MNRKYISNGKVRFIWELVHKNRTEVCGFLTESDQPALYVTIDRVGEEKEGRGMCTHSQYTKYIWHTHPVGTKSYPSSEDIIKVLKKRSRDVIRSSVIFSIWGVWEMSSGRKSERVSDSLKTEISQQSNGIYHIFYKDNPNPNIKKIYQFIQTYIQALEYLLVKYKFKISFVPWDSIGQGSYFLRYP